VLLSKAQASPNKTARLLEASSVAADYPNTIEFAASFTRELDQGGSPSLRRATAAVSSQQQVPVSSTTVPARCLASKGLLVHGHYFASFSFSSSITVCSGGSNC
jgi:hypothetical protein